MPPQLSFSCTPLLAKHHFISLRTAGSEKTLVNTCPVLGGKMPIMNNFNSKLVHTNVLFERLPTPQYLENQYYLNHVCKLNCTVINWVLHIWRKHKVRHDIFVLFGHGQNYVHECVSVHKWESGQECERVRNNDRFELNAEVLVLDSIIFLCFVCKLSATVSKSW